MLTIKVVIEDDDGAEHETELPAHYEICTRCSGHGTVDHPDLGALTSEDFAEDPDLRANYSDRVYDVTCPKCRGLRVVPTVDVGSLTPEQKATWATHCESERTRREADREDACTRAAEQGER
jgi:hypothetical protein